MEFKNLNKKGEFLARDFIIIAILFGAVVLLGYLMVGDMEYNYNEFNTTANMTDESFQSNYDTLTEASGTIYEMQNATASGEGMTTISTYTTFFTATFSIISLIFGSLGMMKNTMANFATDFGVPSAVANIFFPAILVILIATLVFVIISAVSRGRI